MSVAVEFSEVEIPSTGGGPGRKAEPNPYLGVVANMKLRGEDGAKALTTRVPHARDSAEVRKMISQLQAAGKVADPPRSVRVKTEESDGETTLTVWAIPRITPTRAEDTAASPASEGAPDPDDADSGDEEKASAQPAPVEKPRKAKAA